MMISTDDLAGSVHQEIDELIAGLGEESKEELTALILFVEQLHSRALPVLRAHLTAKEQR